MKYYFIFDMTHGMTYRTEPKEGSQEEARRQLESYNICMGRNILTVVNSKNIFSLNTSQIIAIALVMDQD